MKKVINFSLNNKLAIWILSLIVIFMGITAGLNMKQETMPDIELPNVSVMTTYPGAAPDVVADDITQPIEQKLQYLKDVELIMSSSMANASSVQVQFDYGTDMTQATNDIKEALEDIALPEGAGTPDVMHFNLNAFPIMALSITDKDQSIEHLTATIEDNVLPELEKVSGVQEVQISGQQMQEVKLTFKDDKLKEYNLEEQTVKDYIEGSDIIYPLGLTTFDKEVKNVVVDGDISSVKALKNLEIPYTPEEADGMAQEMPADMMDEAAMEAAQAAPEVPTVKLKDIANIKVVSTIDSISKTNGDPSIGLNIVKGPEANTVDVVNAVKAEIEKLESTYGFTAIPTFDQGEPIEDSVKMMLEKAIFGIVFAVIVILLFLRNIRTTIISVISIPLSLLMALFLLDQMDVTLNILTLSALTVAIGRVIDDSIVVMENIYRRMTLSDEKFTGKELIQEATRQMFIPIASSTIVTIVVFLPLILVGGMVGELFMPFALSIVFALAASLLVAVTIVPMLSHSLFKKQLYNAPGAKSLKKQEGHGKIAEGYKKVLKWALNHKIITFGSATVLLIASLFLIPVIGANFLPEDEQKVLMVTYSPDPGQTKESSEEMIHEGEAIISERDGVEMYQFSISSGGDPMSAMMGGGSDNSGLFFVEYDKDFAAFAEEEKELVEKLNDEVAEGEWSTVDFTGMGDGLELYVYGDSIADVQKAAADILPVLEEHEELEQASASISDAYDQYSLVVNQEKISKAGLTAGQVGMAISKVGEKETITTVRHEEETIDVILDVEEVTYDSIKDITKIELDTPLGTKVKIADVVDVKEGKSPETIERRDNKIYTTISADILAKDVAGVSSEVKEEIDALDLPKGVSVDFGGVTEQIEDAFTQLGLAMVAAVAIVYFVLVVTFGGGLAPFAILFSLPYTVIGSLVALWIAREPLDVSSMIGGLMLIGIVVTNAIVLIDRAIRNEESGLTTRDALIEAGATRLRPILMTALATIGALVPLLFGLEGSGLISKGLGITVIGGLTSSTILTLVIVPIVYEAVMKLRKKPKYEND